MSFVQFWNPRFTHGFRYRRPQWKPLDDLGRTSVLRVGADPLPQTQPLWQGRHGLGDPRADPVLRRLRGALPSDAYWLRGADRPQAVVRYLPAMVLDVPWRRVGTEELRFPPRTAGASGTDRGVVPRVRCLLMGLGEPARFALGQRYRLARLPATGSRYLRLCLHAAHSRSKGTTGFLTRASAPSPDASHDASGRVMDLADARQRLEFRIVGWLRPPDH